jgi:hypothetical protein
MAQPSGGTQNLQYGLDFRLKVLVICQIKFDE